MPGTGSWVEPSRCGYSRSWAPWSEHRLQLGPRQPSVSDDRRHRTPLARPADPNTASWASVAETRPFDTGPSSSTTYSCPANSRRPTADVLWSGHCQTMHVVNVLYLQQQHITRRWDLSRLIVSCMHNNLDNRRIRADTARLYDNRQYRWQILCYIMIIIIIIWQHIIL